MESQLSALLPLYQRERAAGRALALAVVLETAGSTYSKQGSLLLIAQDGEYAGLLSGGCLEGDLRERAQAVMSSGNPRTVEYDTRGPDDLLFGLGSGCEGAMSVYLMRVSAENGWQPLQALHSALQAHVATTVEIVREPAERNIALTLELPPRILLLGAGPDAIPVNEFAARLGWKVTLYDHRSAYADTTRFPGAERVVHARAEELRTALNLAHFEAAVVMSHHLPSDLLYLRALAASTIRYVGLLGPAPRRERLRTELGADAAQLAGRLRSPVGLALGGRSAEAIALAIVAEIHAWLHNQQGGFFSTSASANVVPVPTQ
jgi:xanthine/CO dehydrogenase XdhC/CoxF family maturation factor